MRNKLALLSILIGVAFLGACHFSYTQVDEDITPLTEVTEKTAAKNAEFDMPIGPKNIRTPDGANALDLETPLRCNVNWQTQQLILTLPFNNTAFKLQSLPPS
ncbi:MAG TPA: hypothetical protein DIC64_01785, partial [Alphaproteobacteria bacterium]|nr:hypothetical protein [Alphaproteobacteria bacterium]